jgi:hypothetical protein
MPLEFYETSLVSVARMGAALFHGRERVASRPRCATVPLYICGHVALDRCPRTRFDRHHAPDLRDYSGGGQVSIPIRNRIAKAYVVRDPHSKDHKEGGLRHQPVGLRGWNLLRQNAGL